jgi:hypothetical protein
MMGLLLNPASLGERRRDFGPSIGHARADIGSPNDQNRQPSHPAIADGRKRPRALFLPLADWCPYCQAQMMDLNTPSRRIERRGYRMPGFRMTARKPSGRSSTAARSVTRCCQIPGP